MRLGMRSRIPDGQLRIVADRSENRIVQSVESHVLQNGIDRVHVHRLQFAGSLDKRRFQVPQSHFSLLRAGNQLTLSRGIPRQAVTLFRQTFQNQIGFASQIGGFQRMLRIVKDVHIARDGPGGNQ